VNGAATALTDDSARPNITRVAPGAAHASTYPTPLGGATARYPAGVTQRLPTHASPAAHARPHAPQCTRVVTSVSQPSSGSSLQSPRPATHATPHTPRAHVGCPPARAGHSAPHDPQWSASVVGSTQPLPQRMRPVAQAATHAPA
jgi:hypothetical protein